MQGAVKINFIVTGAIISTPTVALRNLLTLESFYIDMDEMAYSFSG